MAVKRLLTVVCVLLLVSTEVFAGALLQAVLSGIRGDPATTNSPVTNGNAEVCGKSGGNPTQKQQIRDLLQATLTRNPAAPGWAVMADSYIQHNLGAQDTKQGILNILPYVPANASIITHRVFQDGDYVIAHNEYHVAGPKIAFDVYHFVDGLVVEHWDNLQAKPDTVNPSRRSMTDGPVEAKKLTLAETEANKAIAKSFVNDILRDGKVDRLAGYFHCDDYIQHNPAVADGVSTFAAARNSTSWNLKYNRVRFTLGDGDFVLVASEGSVAGSPTGFYDLFRLENGKLAEHWDVVEPIPPRDKWVNNNAKF